MNLPHFNEEKRAHMVDISEKSKTMRLAIAQSTVRMKEETLAFIINQKIKKGDVLAVAQVAGVMAAKKTSDIIPMCHPLLLTKINLAFSNNGYDTLIIVAEVMNKGQTGVEMEALTACSVAALTVYDMCKAIDKEMIIENTCLIEKKGGKSGHFYRQ